MFFLLLLLRQHDCKQTALHNLYLFNCINYNNMFPFDFIIFYNANKNILFYLRYIYFQIISEPTKNSVLH